MNVIVIGGGLIGITSAYFLRRQGHEVTVIDREEGPGQATSFANGALLTPSMSDPWNTPGCWRALLSSLSRSNAPMQLRFRVLPSLASWGIQFLRNSRVALFERNTLSNLRLALYSLDAMHALRQQIPIEYGRGTRGTLRIFRDSASLNHASNAADRLASVGLTTRRLTVADTVEFEPALGAIANQLVGALHYKTDETGDAYRFCMALADEAREQGVEFCFRTEVTSIEMRADRVTAVVSHHKRFAADRYIVAAGSYSTLLLKLLGIRLPVRPVKGYSVTLNAEGVQCSLATPIIDDHLHAAIVPLEGVIRAAGTAEFAGFDRTMDPKRIRNLLSLLQDVIPQARFDLPTAKPWCGLRATSVDGVPIIGPTPIANLLVNTGHGHLGWTMAAGSAQLLADLVCGQSPAIDAAPYDFKRFA